MAVSAPPAPSRASLRSGELALSAYESFAPYYDRFTEECKYEKWLISIEAWAIANGLAGNRLLDVACGTGKSFAPLLDRGYQVTACDLSPAMVAVARRKFGERVKVCVADMRELDWRNQFDLITCIDDAMNYLLTRRDLARALAGMARALRPGGILVFDTNSLATFRTSFAQEYEFQAGPVRYRSCGEGSPTTPAGTVSSATLEATGPDGASTTRHVERHWPVSELRDACSAAGLSHIRFRGQLTGCRLLGEPDEQRHTKVVCLARKGVSSRKGCP